MERCVCKETAVRVFSENAISQVRICFRMYIANFVWRFIMLVEMYNIFVIRG